MMANGGGRVRSRAREWTRKLQPSSQRVRHRKPSRLSSRRRDERRRHSPRRLLKSDARLGCCFVEDDATRARLSQPQLNGHCARSAFCNHHHRTTSETRVFAPSSGGPLVVLAPEKGIRIGNAMLACFKPYMVETCRARSSRTSLEGGRGVGRIHRPTGVGATNR